jgi:hypothetical protein
MMAAVHRRVLKKVYPIFLSELTIIRASLLGSHRLLDAGIGHEPFDAGLADDEEFAGFALGTVVGPMMNPARGGCCAREPRSRPRQRQPNALCAVCELIAAILPRFARVSSKYMVRK